MSLTRNDIIIGDARTALDALPGSSVDMVLTSPPYYRLRNYGVDGQLGAESSVAGWVDELRLIAQAVHRVLTPTGTYWLNVGDTFSARPREGAPRKSLLLGPERLALTMVEDGWVLRSRIAWHKPNPVPTSVRDRLTSSWEYIYVFAKQPRYHFDLDAIRVPHTSAPTRPRQQHQAVAGREAWRGPNSASAGGLAALKAHGLVGHPLGKNPSDSWHIAASNYRGSHHATFPIELARRAIAAGCPEARCTVCRLPWQRPLIRSISAARRGQLAPSCTCPPQPEPGLVLDPFMGSGTTAIAAEALQRDWLGIELSPDFAAEAHQRIAGVRPGRQAAA